MQVLLIISCCNLSHLYEIERATILQQSKAVSGLPLSCCSAPIIFYRFYQLQVQISSIHICFIILLTFTVRSHCNALGYRRISKHWCPSLHSLMLVDVNSKSFCLSYFQDKYLIDVQTSCTATHLTPQSRGQMQSQARAQGAYTLPL